MKIATYNIQNLFHRDKNLSEKTYSKCVSDWINELDDLMSGKTYPGNRIDRIQELAFLLGFEKTYHTPYAVMRRRAGSLFLKGVYYSKEVKANELTDWNGWVSIKTVPLDRIAIQNKARVIAEINPDILLLQEIEDRASLEEFNAELLPEFECLPFQDLTVLQSSDKRGLETGSMLKNSYRVTSIKSHRFDVVDSSNLIKEFLQYEILTQSKEILCLLAAQLQEDGKEKDKSDAIRKKQANYITNIYQDLREEGQENIIIAGTLNAVSYCDSLSPLLRNTDLKDVTKHSSFKVDFDQGKDASYFRLGAYRKGVNIKQKDYLLLSPKLFSKIEKSGLNRKGVWPNKKPMWSIYSSIDNKNQAASEHPAIWAEIKL